MAGSTLESAVAQGSDEEEVHASPAVVLDAKIRAFMRGGVSIVAASRTPDNTPCLSRAVGCTVLADNRLLIYLPSSRSLRLVEAIKKTGHIAVVFSEPSSHKTIQVKSSDAEIVGSTRGDGTRLAKYCAAFTRQLTNLGYSDAMAHALVGVGVADVTGIAFTPTALFDQTPGPRAGEPLVRTR